MLKSKKEAPKPLVKKHWTLKVEAMVPATITYQILAETPEQAITLIKTSAPKHVQYKLVGKKNLKATVYDLGSSMIRLVKNLAGIA